MPLDTPRPSYQVPEEALRATVRRLGSFSISHLAAEVGLGERATAYRVRKLVSAGIVRWVRWGRYEYIAPDGPGAAALADIERRKVRASGEMRAAPGPVAGAGRSSSPNKEVRKLLSSLVPGARVSYSGSGHIIVEAGGGRATIPSTPGDKRALHNARADLRRIGALEVA